MKMLCAVLVMAAGALLGCAPNRATTPQPGWHLYHNSKYGYEIQYPDGYGLWETGLEGQSDGQSIRIGWEEYQALTPMLDVQVEPRLAPGDFASLPARPEDLRVEVDDIQVNGLTAKLAQYYWKETGDLAFAQVSLRGVAFRFSASPSMRELRGTPWWSIISTFRFTKE